MRSAEVRGELILVEVEAVDEFTALVGGALPPQVSDDVAPSNRKLIPFSELSWAGCAPRTLRQDVDDLVKQAAAFSSKQILRVTQDFDPVAAGYGSSYTEDLHNTQDHVLAHGGVSAEAVGQPLQDKFLWLKMNEFVEPIQKSDYWHWVRRIPQDGDPEGVGSEEGWAPASLLEELAMALRDLRHSPMPSKEKEDHLWSSSLNSSKETNAPVGAPEAARQENLSSMLADDSDMDTADCRIQVAEIGNTAESGTSAGGRGGTGGTTAGTTAAGSHHASSALLSLREADTVVILLRHYSGWCFCRHVEGSQKEGWVPDSYLKPYGSKDSLDLQPFIQKVKKFRVIGESLTQVTRSAEYADGKIAQILATAVKMTSEQTELVSGVIEYLTGEVGGVHERSRTRVCCAVRGERIKRDLNEVLPTIWGNGCCFNGLGVWIVIEVLSAWWDCWSGRPVVLILERS